MTRFVLKTPDTHQREQMVRVQALIENVALYLAQVLPESRFRSLALTKLEEAQAWSNKAITADLKSP